LIGDQERQAEEDPGARREVTMARQSPRALVGTAALVVAMVGVCCHSSEDGIVFDRSDSGRTVALAVGQEFEIALDSVGPGGFATPIVSSESVRFLRESVSAPSGPPTPGGGKTQRFQFEAVASGRAEVSIPFDPSGWTFGMTVQVY
jgi:hypothetical protein